jgi:hypothetical protein
MTLITTDELARGACLLVFGSAAGMCTVSFPGSPIWLIPAAAAVGGCALTVPEIRREALPSVTRAVRALLPDRNRDAATDGAAPPVPPAAPSGGRGKADRAPPDLLATLKDQPHRLVIGHTRGGKTTLLHKLATDWAAAGARVVVCDPDAAPGLWPGCEAAGHGDDQAAIAQMLHAVRAEVQTRRAQRAQGVRRFAPLHLVIDEAHDVVAGVPGALDLVEDIARRGAKLGVHLTIGVQDRQVKTLGLEGKSAILSNFQTVEMLRDADGRRIALLHDPVTGERRRMDVPELPDPERLIARSAQPPAHAGRTGGAGADAALLEALLAAPPVTGGGAAAHDAAQATVCVDRPPGHLTVNVTAVAGAPVGGRTRALAPALRDAYRQAGAAGESFRAAYRRLGGNRNDALAAWRQGRAVSSVSSCAPFPLSGNENGVIPASERHENALRSCGRERRENAENA